MKTFITIILIIAIALGCACFEAWIGMLLFNWVMGLFGCSFTLTFLQAFGIFALLNFLTGSFSAILKKNK